MIVTEIWRYPVKSAQGELALRSLVTRLGLEWDRQLAVVDMVTGRALLRVGDEGFDPPTSAV